MKPKDIKDEGQYKVTLKERAEVFGLTLYPGRSYILRGDALKMVLDKVENAEPV